MKPYVPPVLTELTGTESEKARSLFAGKHTCHAHGCNRSVPPRMFACTGHWHSLRPEMKAAIWREYHEGQERTKDPTFRYLAVQQRAVAEIVMYKPKSARGLATWNEDMCKTLAAPYLENSEYYRRVTIERGEGDPLEGLIP